MTPMLKQYFTIKDNNPGCILFFRVGDFYETYGSDAEITSKELDIVLTSKDSGEGNKVGMAGVPYFAVDQYLHSMVNKGYKVALCDQVEDAKKAKGLVKREVVRIVSSGTILDPEMLDKKQNNYLVCLLEMNAHIGIAAADISTGDFLATQFLKENEDAIEEEFDRINPREMILCKSLSENRKIITLKELKRIQTTIIDYYPDKIKSEESLKNYFKLRSLQGKGFIENESAMCACAMLLEYLKDMQKSDILSLRIPEIFSHFQYLSIDSTSKRNLELTETIMERARKGSLLWAIDETSTAMGARLLRSWLIKPLIKKSEIETRLDSVEELIGEYETTLLMSKHLKKIQDIERLLSKAIYGTCNARDLIGLLDSLESIPEIKKYLVSFKSQILLNIGNMNSLDELKTLLLKSINPSPPATLREGNIIRDGYNKELDELRDIRKTAKTWIADLEERERKRTGIKSLKIGFNQVFGYYIEITRSNIKTVPEDYIRKQTIAGGERYINQELKEYENKVLSAEEKIKNLEYDLFTEIRNNIVKQREKVQEVSVSIATLDVLLSFAINAVNCNYSRPVISDKNVLSISEGRHPVVEKIIAAPFIKNDLYLDDEDRIIIITGPNMSGKSTYLRQSAIISIMTQMGSFVPAKKAEIGIIDKIFTRVGATDDLHLGQSTFMVEMLETANIINNATEKSLVILDEIGRGTSTFDGLSIAWAVAEYLYEKIKSKTLFATHFHELTQLSKHYSGIKNRKVAVKETGEEVIFLHKILPGASDKSYGIYVAKLAGFPEKILRRADEILEDLENRKKQDNSFSKKNEKEQLAPKQLTFFKDTDNPIVDEIRKLNIMDMTPIQALNKIYKWQKSIDRFKNLEN